MQRSIDRLLKSTLDKSKEAQIINKDGKIKFDRRIYDLDVYKTILLKVKGFDYRTCKLDINNLPEFKKIEKQDPKGGPGRLQSVLEYKDQLT